MSETRQVRVVAKRMVAEGIAAFELAPIDDQPLPVFEAGAHIDVRVPGGPVRQYSLYELPGKVNHYCIAILKDPNSRGGSERMLEGVGIGDDLTVSTPRNHFALASGASHHLLFAGGIGITPILCMAQQLHREGKRFELHYSGHALSRMAFVDQIHAADYSDSATVYLSVGEQSQRLDARTAIGPPEVGKHLYVCGPIGYMNHVLDTARALGWKEPNLHREHFSNASSDHSADRPFEIELKKRGLVVQVSADASASQALVAAGVDISLSCEQGVCGTCVTGVLAGVPDHRDLYLSAEEQARNDCFMPCCSRSLSPRLVLDL